MTTHIQQNELTAGEAGTGLPRPSMVAAITGVVLAGLLVILAVPLLAAAGLWMVGMALALIGYALVSNRHFNTAVWDTAIIGQGLGLLGMALLFGASLLG